MAMRKTLEDILKERTRPGELYEKLPNDWLRCYACGHLCRIPPGALGVCKVRFNEGGVLKVPHGYVGGLQIDPIEKKPFFHALPGAPVLSFGMLGCDYHCGYCFTGDTTVMTDRGPQTLQGLFDESTVRVALRNGEAGAVEDCRAVTDRGRLRAIRQVFRHPYRGPLVTIRPMYLPALRSTPEHRVLAASESGESAEAIAAREIRQDHLLVVPKPQTEGSAQVLDLGGVVRHEYVETSDAFLVPIRSIETEHHDGFVYNMEVDEDHSYLAGLFAVKNCQNWITSQALRDPSALSPPEEITPETMVRLAQEHGVPVIASTYNEPLITSEWAVEIFRRAKAAGIRGAYISNGNATPQVLDYLRPWVDLYKVDLKSFDDKNYRKLGGVLETVLRTIRMLKERDFWVEVVTLVVPGFNDSDDELRRIAGFLASVSPDIPWHVTAFHQDYKMLDNENTSAAALLRAARIGEDEGLRYVYAGNVPGGVSDRENTRCPSCGTTLIRRFGMRVLENLIADGCCPNCATAIAGVWA